MVVYGAEFINKFGAFTRSFESQIEKIILSRPHISIKYIPQIKGDLIKKTVYLGHDIHYERMNREKKMTFDKNYMFFSDTQIVKEVRKQEVSLWNYCNKVAYFTKREADIVNSITGQDKAVVIPLFKNRLHNYEKIKSPKKKGGFLFVGGFDHQPNRDGLLWLLNGLELHGKEFFKYLTIVGSKIPDDVKKILSLKDVAFFENATNERLDEIYAATAVVIAPLRYGSGFKGKVLEAVERGIPVITTSIGYEGFNLTPSIKPCDDIKLFVQQMYLLHKNDDERKKTSSAQSAMLEDYFSVAKYQNIF
jgi:glycosyltransferase involved in cell wall biosynthesis